MIFMSGSGKMTCKALTKHGKRCNKRTVFRGYCARHHNLKLPTSEKKKVKLRKYKILDLYRFVESLKFRPETYHTILLDQFNNKSTETTKIRKKVSRFVKDGLMASGMLDGESGTKIFYSLEKKYFIFIIRANGKYSHYYCSDVDDKFDEMDTIVLYNTFILRDFDWEYLGNISIKKKDIIRWF